MKPIASMVLLAVLPTGEERNISIEIGVPYAASAGQWRCPVDLSGLHGRLPDIAGVNSFQSLALALRTVHDLLGDFVKDGGQLLDPQSREIVALKSYFSTR